jgi:transcriptional regulator with XRE-family HTH domain
MGVEVGYVRPVAGAARRGPGPLSHALGRILTHEAAEQGLSGRQLARMVDVSQPQMAGYLRGEFVLNIEELQAICNVLGLDLVDVMREALNS